MKNGTEPHRRKTLLNTITPYPWHRNRKGDLCGRNGRPLYFQGTDALVIEHAPVIFETLVAIRSQAGLATGERPGDQLRLIWHLADELISDLDSAAAEPRLRIVGTIA